MAFFKKKFYSALKQRYLQFIMINARLCSSTSHHCISGPRRLKRDLLQTDSSAHVWQSAQWDISMNLTETTTITQGCYWSLVLMCACSTVQKSLATPLFNVLLPKSQPFMSVLKWSPATVLQALQKLLLLKIWLITAQCAVCSQRNWGSWANGGQKKMQEA